MLIDEQQEPTMENQTRGILTLFIEGPGKGPKKVVG